ncbi:MAG: hypothetical protein JWM41_2890 [Gemmatimonadetes bacterium]|nr:hypothetical protein [Gemmatimonadota bacterium]
MIDSQSVITDAQLLAAFDTGPVKRPYVSMTDMAESLRHVADMTIAAYVDDRETAATAAMNNMRTSLDHLTKAIRIITPHVLMGVPTNEG